MVDQPKWIWEKTDVDRSGSSGDLAKLFKNETVKVPGVLAIGAPSDHATLMAREVIQNSADAARELQSELGEDAPEFAIDFEFSDLDGGAKADLVEVLGLSDVAARATNPSVPGWRSQLGLDDHGTLDELDSSRPVRTLRITECGTTGMYGRFEGAESKMYLALVALGYTVKASGSGGSYGYGKAGLIRGSAIRMVIAYSAFGERDSDPGVTRRLLGMTYWGQHDLDGDSYTGFARLGAVQENGAVHPLENEEADAMAERLGLDVRDPYDADDLGTTFLLIAPTVDASDLNQAITRNWWPALEDGQLTVSITHEGGHLTPRPMKDPLLRTFVDAYHIATTNQDATKPERYRKIFRKTKLGNRQYAVGSVGLVADPGGWSYEEHAEGDGLEIDGRSLVALVRGPRMVVEYFDAGRARPYVRGVFVADTDIDDLLRQTEPKSHDAWQTSHVEAGTPREATEAARVVERRVREHVRRFRERLKPAARPVEDVRLPELSRLFGRMFGSGPVAGPRRTERPFSIQVDSHVEQVDERAIAVTGKVAIALSDSTELDEVLVRVTLDYRAVEDGGAGVLVPIEVEPPPGFRVVESTADMFEGLLGRKRVDFLIDSAPYPSDWSGRLRADVDFASAEESM